MAEEIFDPHEVARFENATWSRCAGGYAEEFGTLATEAIGSLLDVARVGPDSLVLDVGTGPGLVAAAAAARGATPIGIDFSEAMVMQARRAYPALQFHNATAEALPFSDEAFDAVVGNFVLHHLAHPQDALGEAHRVLRPGGSASFTVWAEPSQLDAFGLFFVAVEAHASSAALPHGPLFGVSDAQVFHRMLRDAGFRDSTVRTLPIAWRMTELDHYISFFSNWANLAALPATVRGSIVDTVRTTAGRYWSGDEYVIPNPAILVAAVK
jgi:ubiquinone/menaquinone biosynthesis C-methylase UbiE